MPYTFIILAGIILAGALAAVLLRKLVHAVLCLTLTFAGLAAVYLQLGAQFIGFAQILVYVGAVAILIVFALLLTRNSESAPGIALASPSWLIGAAIAALVFGVLSMGIVASRMPHALKSPPELTTLKIGERLMSEYVLPLEVLGLLLTAAMIGAVVLAMSDQDDRTSARGGKIGAHPAPRAGGDATAGIEQPPISPSPL